MARKPINEDKGKTLCDVLADDDQRDTVLKPPPDVPNPYPRMSEHTTVKVHMAPAFERILTATFSANPWREYEEVEASLRVGGRGYTDYDTLMAALNDAETNARRAHKLYCAAREEQERYELDAREIEGAARRVCVRELEAEKASGQRAKAITNDDVESRMFERYPDEYKNLQHNRLRYRKMVEDVQHLVEMSNNRCRSLQSMVSKVR